MNITVKQSYVLANLHRIVMRPTLRGRLVPYLDGMKCCEQVYSLAAKKLVVLDPTGRPMRLGKPSGVVRTRRDGDRSAIPPP